MKIVMVSNGLMLHYEKYFLNMKINHSQPWSNVALWPRSCQYENQSWSVMVSHVYFRILIFIRTFYCDKYCFDMKSIIVNHGQSWSTMVQHHIMTKIVSIWKETMVNHHRPWSTMVQHHIVTNIFSIWKSTMVNHGQPWLTMVNNHGHIVTKVFSWSSVTLWQK